MGHMLTTMELITKAPKNIQPNFLKLTRSSLAQLKNMMKTTQLTNVQGLLISARPLVKGIMRIEFIGFSVLDVSNFDGLDQQNIFRLPQFLNDRFRNFTVDIDDADRQTARCFAAESNAGDVDFRVT